MKKPNLRMNDCPLGHETKDSVSAEAGFTLLQSILAVALLGALLVTGNEMTKSMSSTTRLTVSRANAVGTIAGLEAFIELRLANFFQSPDDICNLFNTEMANSFATALIEADNLLLELATPANLAPIPANLLPSATKSEFVTQWNACNQDLPAIAPSGSLKFCIRLARADTTKSAQHIATSDPTFATVEARLINVVNNSSVNCPAFVSTTTTPARAFEIRYNLFWTTPIDSGLLVMKHGGQFFGSPTRGMTP